MSSPAIHVQGQRSNVVPPDRTRAHRDHRSSAKRKKQAVPCVLHQHKDPTQSSGKASPPSVIEAMKFRVRRRVRQHPGTSVFQVDISQNHRASGGYMP
ncbi:hypothetical protein DY000_02022084 [Brassica cretica]|uniref:Uncharacterized protein n=1 Tax=Brassica cretica TaxID=69181 RepID=A0ABQ7E176_BRACR|nr:hypothetical protein DY000_02022084 [Brassica cretica]